MATVANPYSFYHSEPRYYVIGMSRYIVTTTIHPPTSALTSFSQMEDWQLIVVGDTKTPHEAYKSIDCIYLHPQLQDSKYKTVSDLIGWNTIQRRNIGFLEAYKLGAEIVATVDDDNIPYDDWGTDLYVGQTIEVPCFSNEGEVFDPLSITNDSRIWHRGFPVELLSARKPIYHGMVHREVLVQADLWDGNPDVDAIARLVYKPCVKYDVAGPYCSNTISPFNSQNTFISREVLPYYAVFPHTGRMDDIWGGYFLQILFPNSLVYNRASVFQQRNEHDLISDLEEEIVGYRNTLELIHKWKKMSAPPYPVGTHQRTIDFYQEYRKAFR